MPALPKPAGIRQRTNRSSTTSVLSSEHSVKAPKLPTGRKWHAMTKSWWSDIWASPMAPEFLEADTHGLFSLAILEDDFWNLTTETYDEVEDPVDRHVLRRRASACRITLMAEIRLQRQCYGLTPIDRRRLQWQVEQGETAAEKTRRRQSTPAPVAADTGFDPRARLKAVPA